MAETTNVSSESVNVTKFESSTNIVPNEKHRNIPNGSSFIYCLTLCATIGGLLFGYHTAIVSGAMLLIGELWQLDTVWKEAIVSATIGTAAVFALVAGYLSDIFGRKPVLMVASLIFTAGSVVMAAANNKFMLMVGRLIIGSAIGE
jgi:SP family myo-inositol transporter-like MFS transporter 13